MGNQVMNREPEELRRQSIVFQRKEVTHPKEDVGEENQVS